MEIIIIEPSENLERVARLYAQVFAGWPWNEVSLCPSCQEFRPDQPGQICACGNGTLGPAYPTPETAEYISSEISKPLAVALLAVAVDEPVGFAWGYQLTGSAFAMNKYKKPESQAIIEQAVGNTTYFYISEVGVNPRYQGQRLGTKLTLSLAENNPGLPLLMRTNSESPMLKIATNKLSMTPVVAANLSIVDPENPSRVVLVKFP